MKVNERMRKRNREREREMNELERIGENMGASGCKEP